MARYTPRSESARLAGAPPFLFPEGHHQGLSLLIIDAAAQAGDDRVALPSAVNNDCILGPTAASMDGG